MSSIRKSFDMMQTDGLLYPLTLLLCLKNKKVQSTAHHFAPFVSAVPRQALFSCGLNILHQSAHRLTENIANNGRYLSGFTQGITDLYPGVEGIGITAQVQQIWHSSFAGGDGCRGNKILLEVQNPLVGRFDSPPGDGPIGNLCFDMVDKKRRQAMPWKSSSQL